MRTYFYYLKDPRDNQIKYIGQSKNPRHRYFGHIHDAKFAKDKNTRKVNWIKGLLQKEMKPILEVFEEYLGDVENAHKREWKHIIEHREKGHILVNGNDGGTPYLLPDDRIKKVHQYNKETGEFIKEFRCPFDAFCETGIKDSNIGRACREEGIKPKFPGGFIWSYNKYEKFPLDSIPENFKYNRKKILVTKDNFSKEYYSAREASRELNIDYKGISACATGKQETIKGYKVSFVMI